MIFVLAIGILLGFALCAGGNQLFGCCDDEGADASVTDELDCR